MREEDFPLEGRSTEKLTFLLRYAILAPSGHNSQPWKFSVNENEIRVIADTTRWLKLADPDQASLHIAIGCALENLLIAAEHFGYGFYVTILPDPKLKEWVATVMLTPDRHPSSFRPPSLFDAILERRTNRRVYKDRPLSKSDLSRLRNCCIEEGIDLHMIDDGEGKRRVKDLCVQDHTTLVADPAFRSETAYWFGQGLFNIPGPVNKLIQWVAPYLNVSTAMAFMDNRLIMSAPVLAVLSSDLDDRMVQIKTGQVFERICLTATMAGIGVQPLSASVDVPELKARMRKMLPNQDHIPLHVFRLGYADPVKAPAQRRPL